jgi:predicted dehydrogenase
MSASHRQVRVGVIGTGAIAQVAHLPILSRMRGVELAGLYDSDRSIAETIAGRFQAERVYRRLEEMLEDETVDAVIVCTPSHLHAEQAAASIDAGKFVLCEKPLALDAAGAKKVLGRKGAEERLMVGMNQRFRPDASLLKSFVDGGELGEIFYLRSGWLNRRSQVTKRSWREKKQVAGGGALMDLGIQMLDLSLWLLDYPQPERVSCHTHAADAGDVEDSAVVLLHLEGGRVLNLEVTWALRSERERQYVHLLGSSGSGSLGPLKVYKEMATGLTDLTPQIAPGRENQFTASYRHQLAYFLDLVRGNRDNEPPREHVTLMRIVEGAYRAAQKGAEVRF